MELGLAAYDAQVAAAEAVIDTAVAEAAAAHALAIETAKELRAQLHQGGRPRRELRMTLQAEEQVDAQWARALEAIEFDDLESFQLALSELDGFACSESHALVAAAAKADNIEMVEALLEVGADPELTHDPDGWRAVHWAVLFTNASILAVLIDAGASVDATAYDGVTTPLRLATEVANDLSVQMLLAAGARPNTHVDGSWEQEGETARISAQDHRCSCPCFLLANRCARANCQLRSWRRLPAYPASIEDVPEEVRPRHSNVTQTRRTLVCT